MLGLYVKLFKRLNEDILYVVWKACNELQMAVEGTGDIDLLVALDSRDRFQTAIGEHGFVHAEFTMLTFPFVEHWYGFDSESEKICHLHVYYKIITGESHLKSYYIPIKNEILSNRFLNSLNLYEAAYSDQALIYAMRHYMKRSSIVGYLLWAYEYKDYLDEFTYIAKGMAHTSSLCEDSNLRKEFDFHSLDIGVNVRGYRTARGKKTMLATFRRFDGITAALKSIYYLVIRVYFRIVRVKKKLDKGLLLAVSGVDGSGKSSMVEELDKWFGKNFYTEILHLGRPSPTVITFPLRPMLYIYRFLKGQNKGIIAGAEDAPSDGLKNRNGFVWGLRYLALAYERYRLACEARDLATKGKIVICDRYPTLSPGKMDSPMIGPGGSKLVEKMRSYELQLYERVPKADGLIFLDVSEEVAIKRNRSRIKAEKETDEVIAFRHKDNQRLEFCAHQVFFVDANRDYNSVLKSLKAIAWGCLLK